MGVYVAAVNAIKSYAKIKGVNPHVRLEKGKGVIIFSELTKQEIEAVIENSFSSPKFKNTLLADLEYVRKEQAEELSTGRGKGTYAQNHSEGALWRMIQELTGENIVSEQEREGLEERIEALTEELGRAQEELERTRKEKDLSVANQRDAERLALELMEGKEGGGVIRVENYHEAIMLYLSTAADSIARAELVMPDNIYDLLRIDVANVEFQNLLDEVNSLCLDLEARTTQDIIELDRKYRLGEKAGENISALYAGKNPGKNEEYRKAGSELESLEKQKKELRESATLTEDVLSGVIAAIDSGLQRRMKVIREYEEGRDEFAANIKTKLGETGRKAQQYDDYTTTKDLIEENIKDGRIPVYIRLGDNDNNFRMQIYIPAKEGSRPKLCELLLSENLLSEKVRGMLSAEEFDRIEKQADTLTKLSFYEITMPKESNKLADALKVKGAIEEAVRSGYENSSLKNLGLRIEVLYVDDVSDYLEREEREQRKGGRIQEEKEQKRGGGKLTEEIKARRNALVRILYGEGRPLLAPEITQKLEEILGYEMKSSVVHNDALGLPDIVVKSLKEGYNRRYTFALKPEYIGKTVTLPYPD